MTSKQPVRLHIGCNTTKINNFVNIDARQTSATDIVHNCANLSIFDNDSVDFIFSHAFFEHLYYGERPLLLKDAYRVLNSQGILYFTGIPDFESIARAYLEKRQGNLSARFDLWEVYRYTHGDPESVSGWWIEQLHKTLFDTETLRAILLQSGFNRHAIYRYAYGTEPNATNFGFIATKQEVLIPPDFCQNLHNQFGFVHGNRQIEYIL
jgi:predicted SAM-dependent methyltransferase